MPAWALAAQLRTTLDKDETRQKLLKNVEPDDLVKFGLIPELIGRLPVVTVLDPLDEEALGPRADRTEKQHCAPVQGAAAPG